MFLHSILRIYAQGFLFVAILLILTGCSSSNVISLFDWNSLFSGFIGTIIGASISTLVARYQVRKTHELQMDWERDRINQQQTKDRTSIVRGLISEASFTQGVIKYFSWSTIPIDVWESKKGEIGFLPDNAQDVLRNLYRFIQLHNSNIVNARAQGDFSSEGEWFTGVAAARQGIRKHCVDIMKLLEDWLQN